MDPDSSPAEDDTPPPPPPLDSFTLFPKLPQELKDKIWEQSTISPGIHFFQHYRSTRRTGASTPMTLPDKYSTSRRTAQLKLASRDAKATLDRIDAKPAFASSRRIRIDPKNRSSDQKAYVCMEKDVICFGSLHQGEDDSQLPKARGAFNKPRTYYEPDNAAIIPGTWVNQEWKQARRVGISYPIDDGSAEAITLAGDFEHGGARHAGSACFTCIGHHLSHIGRLQVVYLLVAGVPKPADQCPEQKYRIEIRQDDGINALSTRVHIIEDIEMDSSDEDMDDAEDGDDAEKPPPPSLEPLEVFYGSEFEYYEVTKCDQVREPLHWLAHLAEAFDDTDIAHHVNRPKPVKFKMLSWAE